MKTKLATVLIANTKQKFLQRRISTFVELSVLKSQADKVQFEHTVANIEHAALSRYHESGRIQIFKSTKAVRFTLYYRFWQIWVCQLLCKRWSNIFKISVSKVGRIFVVDEEVKLIWNFRFNWIDFSSIMDPKWEFNANQFVDFNNLDEQDNSKADEFFDFNMETGER